jgi:hypothetical protein
MNGVRLLAQASEQQLEKLSERVGDFEKAQEEKIADLSERVHDLEIATQFFESVSNTQLTYFSLLVAVLVGASWILTYKVSKRTIAEETRRNLDISLGKIQEELDKKFNEDKKKLESSIAFVRANTFRTLGHVHQDAKRHDVSFVWFIRSAKEWDALNNKSLTRSLLSYANDELKLINFGYELPTGESLDEVRDILEAMDKKSYKDSIGEIEQTLKEVLNRHPTK